MLRSRALQLGGCVLATLLVAVFLLDMIRPQHLLAAGLLVLALEASWAALAWYYRDRPDGTAHRDWTPRPGYHAATVLDEPGLRRVHEAVTSYLSSRYRGDELHPFVVDVARARLLAGHDLVLGADPETDRAVLGPVLHDYLTSPAAAPENRTPEKLAAVVQALEQI